MSYKIYYLLAVFVAVALVAFPVLAKAPNSSNIIPGSTVSWVPMAEWEAPGGQFSVAMGSKEVHKAPPSSTKYKAKAFTFPNGSIRILEFKKNDGGVLHKLTSETELYVLKGRVEVGVGGSVESLKAGDAVHLPRGVLRSRANEVADTTVFLFTVGSAVPAPNSVFVPAIDTKETTRPPGQGEPSVSVRLYPFDGNSIRIASSKAPGSTTPYTGKTDSILYLLSGRMKITIGDQVAVVRAGDALCEPAGLPSHWDVLEDSVFIATSAPVTPSPVPASSTK